MTNSDSVGSSLLVAINKYLAKAARQEDGRYAIAVESPQGAKTRSGPVFGDCEFLVQVH